MKEDIKVFSPAGEKPPMYVGMAGVSYCDGSYRIYRPSSYVTVIEYVLSGDGYVKRGDGYSAVGADSIYILPRGQDHEYYSSAESPWKKIFLNVEGELPVTLMTEYGISDRWLFGNAGLRRDFEHAAELIFGSSPEEDMQEELCALVFKTIARISRLDNAAGHSEEAVKLKAYLDTSTSRIISNRELSAQIFRSPDYTLKLFAREYGTTPYDYQIKEKMRVARRLLRDTSLPVGEIAAAIGYHDPKYFSGLFREKCGIAPREYRNLKRKTAKAE